MQARQGLGFRVDIEKGILNKPPHWISQGPEAENYTHEFCTRCPVLNSLLQQPGPKKFKLSKIELIYKAKKFKVPPFVI